MDLDTIDANDHIAEDVNTFTGLEPQADMISDTLLRDIGVTAHLVSGTCQ
jgi:hypothetical protein